MVHGSGNTAVGDSAQMGTGSATNSDNVAVGNAAQLSLSNAVGNVALGSYAQEYMRNGQNDIGIGLNAQQGLLAGFNNIGIGGNAQNVITNGGDNDAIGFAAQIALINGSQNTALGSFSQYALVSGTNNVAVGIGAQEFATSGNGNTAIGPGALNSPTSGSSNIAVGYFAGNALTGGGLNIDIGNPGAAGDTNLIRIGQGQTDTYLSGNVHGNGGGLTNLPAASYSTNFVGQLSPTNFAAGSGASSSTYLSGAGTWTTPGGGGGSSNLSPTNDINFNGFGATNLSKMTASGTITGGTFTGGGSTNTSLTASRMVLSDANKALVSAVASGAVPINADGSSTTGAQLVTALGTTAVNRATADASGNTISSTYLTGNQTITASGDASGSGTTSLALTITNLHFLTNLLATAPLTIPIANQVQMNFKTNAAFTFAGFSGLSTTNNYNDVMIHVVGAGSALAMTFPANTHVVGTAYVTNQTDVLIHYDLSIPTTNALCVPLF